MAANQIDLITIAQLKSYLGNFQNGGTDDDSTLQELITSFSRYFLNRTGMKTDDAGNSPFVQVCTYSNEIYDGNGAVRIWTDNNPIVAVTFVQCDSIIPPASTGLSQTGYFIERSKRSIAFRKGNGGFQVTSNGYWTGSYRFYLGTGNIAISYTAGYDVTPFDIQECALEAIGTVWERSDTLNQGSKQIGAAGGASANILFTQNILPAKVIQVIANYTRMAVKS